MTKKEIKAKVRERDGYKCVDCGLTQDAHIAARGRRLHVHRVSSGSEYTTGGCVTVCLDCHAKRHSNAYTGIPVRMRCRRSLLLSLPISHELKDAIGEAAEEAGLAMNEWVARLIAEHFGRPDFAVIPRKPYGRPRKLSGAAS